MTTEYNIFITFYKYFMNLIINKVHDGSDQVLFN